jgi:hypothetical protein
MIPYDDLVIALATWRARQGLPVAQLSGALTPPPAAPRQTPPQPQRAAVPPPAPPGRSGPVAAQRSPSGQHSAYFGNIETPPPLESPDDSVDVDEAALLEEAHYESAGDDFALSFGLEAVSTAIGVPPPARPSDTFGGGATVPEPEPPSKKKSGKKNDDW